MVVETAVNRFLGKGNVERLNCAQTILNAFKEEIKVDEEMIQSYKSFGGGRAPGRLCGAIYGAKTILEMAGRSEAFETVSVYFEEHAGSVTCKGIKDAKKMSCHKCVEHSARLVQEILFAEQSTEISREIG